MYFRHPTSGICVALAISTPEHLLATLRSHQQLRKDFTMFFIGILFLGLWIAGEATANTLGGFIHVLLILSFTMLVSQLIRGNRASRVSELASSSDELDQNG